MSWSQHRFGRPGRGTLTPYYAAPTANMAAPTAKNQFITQVDPWGELEFTIKKPAWCVSYAISFYRFIEGASAPIQLAKTVSALADSTTETVETLGTGVALRIYNIVGVVGAGTFKIQYTGLNR